MLSLRASPHFSMGYYQLLTVKDEHIVSGKHYGLAIDISSSCDCENIVYAILETLNAADTLTVVTFGTHTSKETFRGSDPDLKQRISAMLNKSQSGSNVMIGLGELEGEEFILVSDGKFNEGPDANVNTPVHCFSLCTSSRMRKIASSSGGSYEVLGFTKEKASMRRVIRKVLRKPEPCSFDIKVTGDFRTVQVNAMARGGVQTFLVPTKQDGIAHLSYKNKDGYVFEEFCTYGNKRDFNIVANKFIPCVSPIRKPIMRKCNMIEY